MLLKAAVQATLSELLPEAGSNPNIVATGRKLASWDEEQQSWIPQSVMSGNPILVSMDSEGAPANSAELASKVHDLLNSN
jgi:hypothetical protein